MNKIAIKNLLLVVCACTASFLMGALSTAEEYVTKVMVRNWVLMNCSCTPGKTLSARPSLHQSGVCGYRAMCESYANTNDDGTPRVPPLTLP